MLDTEGMPFLGVFTPDTARCVVVVSEDGELAVALADAVDRGYALIRDVRPREFPAVAAAVRPWPWMVVGEGERVPPGLAELASTVPMLIVWLGAAPAGLPRHACSAFRFSDALRMVKRALDADVAGLRLAPGAGVQLPDGMVARSASLEALLTRYPGGFALPLRVFAPAARALRRRGLSWRPMRGATGMVALAPTRGLAA